LPVLLYSVRERRSDHQMPQVSTQITLSVPWGDSKDPTAKLRLPRSLWQLSEYLPECGQKLQTPSYKQVSVSWLRLRGVQLYLPLTSGLQLTRDTIF